MAGVLSGLIGSFRLGAYDLIQTTILGSTTASVTFSGLNEYINTYKHLQLRMVGRSNRAAAMEYIKITFNGDTGSNYSWHRLSGQRSGGVTYNPASIASINQARMEALRFTSADAVANAYGAIITDIVDAYSTTKNKTIRNLGGAFATTNESEIELSSGNWRNTNAITSINIAPGGGTTFNTGSRFSLYGIR
jgi:hypothetical protein